MIMTQLQKQNGISLIEVVLVLTVIIALGMLSVRYFQQTAEAQRIVKAATMINEGVKGARTWLEGHEDYCDGGGITTAKMVALNLLPENYDDSDVNPWGGHLSIEGLAIASGCELDLVMNQIPRRSCLQLVDMFRDQGGEVDEDLCTFERFLWRVEVS